MDRGFYAAASAGLFQMKKLEVVNNNLANVNTPGFKRDLLVADQQNFSETLASRVAGNDPFAQGDHDRVSGVTNMRYITDFSKGAVKITGNPLDAALTDEKDFFVINTPDGVQYTRAGNFTINSEGSLVTQDGMEVQGDGGAISVTGAGATIMQDGSVRTGEQVAGRLQVVRFENTDSLEHAGGNRFKLKSSGGQPETVEASVEPQSLEMANVTSISSVIDLITTQRAFQAYARTTESIEQMNQAATTQVGRNRL